MTTADTPTAASTTPLCDHLRRTGEWNPNWTPFAELDPEWTERFMAVGLKPMLDKVLDAKTRPACAATSARRWSWAPRRSRSLPSCSSPACSASTP